MIDWQDSQIEAMQEEWMVLSPSMWSTPSQIAERQRNPPSVTVLDLLPATELDRLLCMQAAEGDICQAEEIWSWWDWLDVHEWRAVKRAAAWSPPE